MDSLISKRPARDTSLLLELMREASDGSEFDLHPAFPRHTLPGRSNGKRDFQPGELLWFADVMRGSIQNQFPPDVSALSGPSRAAHCCCQVRSLFCPKRHGRSQHGLAVNPSVYCRWSCLDHVSLGLGDLDDEETKWSCCWFYSVNQINAPQTWNIYICAVYDLLSRHMVCTSSVLHVHVGSDTLGRR